MGEKASTGTTTIITSNAPGCGCTGNKGFWWADNDFSSTPPRYAYDNGEDYGNWCNTWDNESYAQMPYLAAQKWCYVPCDTYSKRCSNFTVEHTVGLWRAPKEGVDLCYSYDFCGGDIAPWRDMYLPCIARGGKIRTHDGVLQCSCDLAAVVCIPPSTTTTTSAAIPNMPSDNEPDVALHAGIAFLVVLLVAVAVAAVACFVVSKAQKRKESMNALPLDRDRGGSTLKATRKPSGEARSKVTRVENRNTEVEVDAAIARLYDLTLTENPREPIPFAERTFANSNYKILYEQASGIDQTAQLLVAVKFIILAWCNSPDAPRAAMRQGVNFYNKLVDETFKRQTALQQHISAAAEYMWTSAKSLANTEFCSMVNHAFRQDEPDTAVHLAVFSRALNTRRVVRTMGEAEKASFPPHGRCYRGTGFRDEHRGFFVNGKKFRVPGFLATSFSADTAKSFTAFSKTSHRTCLWCIQLDIRGERDLLYRTRHVALVSKSHMQDESEYLWAPYSVFTVASTKWSSDPEYLQPHEINLVAALDNLREEEDLPLSPWY